VVRKRPQNSREKAQRDFDAVTCINPKAVVHACKLKVDGISKYLENQAFAFDHVSARNRLRKSAIDGVFITRIHFF